MKKDFKKQVCRTQRKSKSPFENRIAILCLLYNTALRISEALPILNLEPMWNLKSNRSIYESQKADMKESFPLMSNWKGTQLIKSERYGNQSNMKIPCRFPCDCQLPKYRCSIPLTGFQTLLGVVLKTSKKDLRVW